MSFYAYIHVYVSPSLFTATSPDGGQAFEEKIGWQNKALKPSRKWSHETECRDKVLQQERAGQQGLRAR